MKKLKIEKQFRHELHKRDINYLDDIYPPELKGLGEKIDHQFKTLTVCLYSWITCPTYQNLIEQDKQLRKEGWKYTEDNSRIWLIKQTKKSLTQMSKRFNADCPYLNFKFEINGYINWLGQKGKTNSVIVYGQTNQRFSPQEIIEIFGERYCDEIFKP